MSLIRVIRGFEERARVRPCARQDLKSLENEFEGLLREARQPGGALLGREDCSGNIKELLTAVDAVRIALRQGVVAHERARSEISRVEGLVARGHLQEAVVESVKLRNQVAEFSDLKLDFVGAAEARQARRQQMLLVLGVVLSVIILVAATFYQLFRRSIPH